MSAVETLREAATGLRDEWSGGNEPRGTAWHRERDLHLAVADMLDACAEAWPISQPDYATSVRAEAIGHRQALAVALAYLGGPS